MAQCRTRPLSTVYCLELKRRRPLTLSAEGERVLAARSATYANGCNSSSSSSLFIFFQIRFVIIKRDDDELKETRLMMKLCVVLSCHLFESI